jgi:hypothetical protein
MRDSQQARVYLWEDGFRSFIERTTTRKDIRWLIRKACALYGVDAPSVQFRSRASGKRMRLSSDYDPSQHAITIGIKDCNHAIAMHEAAHAITDDLHEGVEDHGPEFLGVYLDLLEWANVAPRSALHASAKASGLRWTPARRARKKAS